MSINIVNIWKTKKLRDDVHYVGDRKMRYSRDNRWLGGDGVDCYLVHVINPPPLSFI